MPWMVSDGLSVVLHLLDRLQELRQSFEREELALQRDQNRIRRGHGVDGQKIERRRTIDQHIAVAAFACRRHRVDRLAQPVRAVALLRDLELEAGKIHGRRRDVQLRHCGLHRDRRELLVIGQSIVGRVRPAFAVDAESGRCVALRIEIDDQHALADRSQRGAEIDRRRGLADAALLIGESEYPRSLGVDHRPNSHLVLACDILTHCALYD